MTATTSTAYSRDLGEELRLLRERCSTLNGRKFAILLGWDPSKVSNIEHGKARASEIDLVQYLTACGKDIDYFNDFLTRYRNAFDPYIAQVPDDLRTLAMAESMATKITWVDVLAVPGLIQTREYADALYRKAGLVPEEKIAGCVKFRMDRQSILRRVNRPECRFYVLERVLQTRVGSDKVMEDQYLRMLFNTHILRIVPDDAITLMAGCALLEFDKAPTLAYSETDLAQVFAQDSLAVDRTTSLFKRLDELALDEEQSKRKLAEYVSRLREEPHDGEADLA
ncbi:helix-turn-helix protein [Lentzea atacamensis]|uniref:Helix-turn-helix protein n=2 Tax=Lentzea TaxID=165301 RepID=A0A316I172_9PSEU|nr:helix-turn-helix transcriptional regulator [Lentzea atacamensis]PWK86251.1 helix-turn-helix protein [Lentzea atacamensis]RAS65759.1 helix-turn-helix protein [Lentzea atacamensis]